MLDPRGLEIQRKSLLTGNWPAIRAGLTLVEVVIVAVMTGLLLTAASMLTSRTTRVAHKSTELLNVQATLNQIVERLRLDIRHLWVVDRADAHEFRFQAMMRGRLVRISYTYDPERRRLLRTESAAGEPPQEYAFDATVAVTNLVFLPSFNRKNEFVCLNVGFQLLSDEISDGQKTLLTFYCRFFSRCAQEYDPFGFADARPPKETDK